MKWMTLCLFLLTFHIYASGNLNSPHRFNFHERSEVFIQSKELSIEVSIKIAQKALPDSTNKNLSKPEFFKTWAKDSNNLFSLTGKTNCEMYDSTVNIEKEIYTLVYKLKCKEEPQIKGFSAMYMKQMPAIRKAEITLKSSKVLKKITLRAPMFHGDF